ncbi:replication factor C large subunit [archaeon]|nr:replication factor C large subunit [archaeon]
MAELWTDKFSPKTSEEFIGNPEIVANSLDWAKKWEKGEKQPPLLLWGKTGSGKTSLAYLLAKQFNWETVEINSSDIRSKDAIERIVGAAAQNASFFSSRRLIIIDDVDALTRKDRGGAGAISTVIKNAQNPVILTATDIFANKNVSPLRFVCKTFEFKKINYLSMAKRLRELLDQEKIEYDEEAIKELAKNSNGDMRSALLDLQSLTYSETITMEEVNKLSSRDRQQKVFTVMKAIFKGTNFNEVRRSRTKSDLSNDMIFRWVEENIPRQYTNSNDVALAFDRLSRADMFNGRIYRKQHWGFLRYSSELAAEGVALSKENVSHDFVMYQFPGLLSMLSRTSGVRNLKKSLGKKIGEKTHSSSRTIIRDLPFLEMIFQNKEKAIALTALFDLNDKELALILNTKSETKKVKNIISEAEAIRERNARPKKVFGDVVYEDSIVQEPIPIEKEEEPEEQGNQTKLF